MVCWMGSFPVVILEFPLYEFIVALFYFAFGEQLFIARIVTLAFWVGSAIYLYRLIDLLYTRTVAQLTATVYAILPLGLFYSRAVHIDFAVIFFVHAFCFYLIRSVFNSNSKILYVSIFFGCMAALMKSPYIFAPYFALFVFLFRRRAPLRFYLGLIVPMVLFLVWHSYSASINASAPDYSFLPGYFKFVDMGWWYFGTSVERFHGVNWRILGSRFLYEVTTPYGAILCIAGFLAHIVKRRKERFMVVWLVGVIVYLLLFFPLNVRHNYYQIPFLALGSFFIAETAHAILGLPVKRSISFLLMLIVLSALFWQSWRFSNRVYYRLDLLRVTAGKLIEKNTNLTNLILTSSADSDPRDPRLLYAARRHGFSVAEMHLNQEVLDSVRKAGIKYLALLRHHDQHFPDALKSLSFTRYVISINNRPVGLLYLAEL
jgi:4-amino-4-deoxy-L-arabinose transferase-like glycosyltransferase